MKLFALAANHCLFGDIIAALASDLRHSF
jgi:hypothetical protein